MTPPPDPAALAREAIADDAKATKPPWAARECSLEGPATPKGHEGSIAVFQSSSRPNARADCTFTANARTREPIIARALIALHGENERLRDEIEGLKVEREALQ